MDEKILANLKDLFSDITPKEFLGTILYKVVVLDMGVAIDFSQTLGSEVERFWRILYNESYNTLLGEARELLERWKLFLEDLTVEDFRLKKDFGGLKVWECTKKLPPAEVTSASGSEKEVRA